MNISGALKILEALDPKEHSTALSKLAKEAKVTGETKGLIGKILGSMKGFEGALSGLVGDLDKMHGAMKAKPKPSKEDLAAAKKTLVKMMKDWQANRVKVLEQQIADMEKHLASLKKELATAKGSKPEGWFM